MPSAPPVTMATRPPRSYRSLILTKPAMVFSFQCLSLFKVFLTGDIPLIGCAEARSAPGLLPASGALRASAHPMGLHSMLPSAPGAGYFVGGVAHQVDQRQRHAQSRRQFIGSLDVLEHDPLDVVVLGLGAAGNGVPGRPAFQPQGGAAGIGFAEMVDHRHLA